MHVLIEYIFSPSELQRYKKEWKNLLPHVVIGIQLHHSTLGDENYSTNKLFALLL